MKVVVLGGNTPLGSYICPQLAQAGHSVTCISDNEEDPYNYTDNREWQNVNQIVLDRAATEKEAEALYGKRVVDLNPEIVIDTNCYYLEHCKGLVKALRGTGLKHLIHCGTLHVYSPTQARPWRETAPRGYSTGLFAAQQQEMEKFLKEEHASGAVPVTILLMGTAVGKGWVPLSCQGTYDAMIFDAMQTGGTIMLPEQHQCTLQLLHADDAAQVVLKCVEKPDVVQGEVFNVAGYPVSLQDYARQFPKLLKVETEPTLKERGWWEFSRALANFDYDKAMQSTFNVFHCCAASNIKVIQQLGVTFRDPLVAVQDSLEWMKANPGKADTPRGAKPWDLMGLNGLEFEGVPYSGERPGYIFRDGKDGKGYYVDNGPFVNWQKQSIRRIKQEHAKITFQEGFTRKDAYFMLMLVVMWTFFITILLLYSDTAQGMIVFQSFISNALLAITRHPPRPFTKHLLLNSTDNARVGVWHNMLPVAGYKDTLSDKVKGKAAQRCRTLLYLHGNAENRLFQLDKLRWYMEELHADVLTMDYRGFGDSRCPPKAFTPCPTEMGVYEDAFMVFDYLNKPIAEGGLGIPSQCVVLHGHSLGSAVASRLAVELQKKGKAPGGVVLEAPFTSAWDVLRTSAYSPLVYLPDLITDVVEAIFKPNLKPRFEQHRWIGDFTAPALLLHGDKDRLVPPHMSSTLFKKRADKTEADDCSRDLPCTELLSLPEAHHRNVFESDAAKHRVQTFVNTVWKAK